MTTKTTRPEVGQTLYVATPTNYGHEMKPLVVTRVGRKWFYAAPAGASFRAERQFALDDWRENTYMGAGPTALTADEYAERQARSQALERMTETGYRIERIGSAMTWAPGLTTAQINAIAEIIEKGADK